MIWNLFGNLTKFAAFLCAVLFLQISPSVAAVGGSTPPQMNDTIPRKPSIYDGAEMDRTQEERRPKESSSEQGERQESSSDEAAPKRVVSPELQKADLKYSLFAFSIRQKAFEWQHFSTKVIFWSVLGVVVLGLGLSCVQFAFAYYAPPWSRRKRMKKGSANERPTEPRESVTTIEVSTNAFKITSSVLGVIILALSIIFFFLYLKFVYPITEVTEAQPALSETAPKQP
jgi:hypothetical protein